MTLNKSKALKAAAFARVVAFDKNVEESISIVLPEDLSTLSDADLLALREASVAAFTDLYQGGAAKLSADQVAALRQLKDAKLALDAEKARRTAAGADEAAELAALAAEFSADEAEVEVVAEVEAPAEAEVELAAEVEVPATEVVASGHPTTITVKGIKARQTPVEVETPKAVSPIKAPMGLDGFAAGTEMSMADLADAFAELTEAARPGPIQAAQRSSARFSAKHKVAQIVKPFDKRAIVGDDNNADAALKFATDQSLLKSALGAGSLTAAGGWCAPSETLYDLCKLESTDGILSIPEIQVRRGGIRFTQGPDWADIFANTGFCFTETDDIANNYSLTDEVNTATEGGAGLTSYTLTVNGQTTASIDDDATAAQVQAALEALSNVAPGDVVVTGSTNPIVMRFVWGGLLAGTNVALSSTPTGGTGTVVIATVTEGGQPGGPKPCDVVPCPAFEDVRLDVCGVCIQSGILLNRAYPELVQRYVSGALTAHAHRVATNVLADMIAGSTAVSPTQFATPTEFAAAAPVLSAIELQAEDIKYRYRMARGTTLEAIFPFWARGVIRADLSRRAGVDLLSVTDAQIDGWFRARGISPQFIYNFDNLGTVASGALVWPSTLRFLIYPAGTWVRGSSELITLSMLHDSTLNANNNFTAIFTEEGWSVMKMCQVSRVVTVPVCSGGNTGTGQILDCA